MNPKRYHRQNYYEILGVKQDCSQNDIKSAFIRLSKENHPDGDPHDKTRHSKFVLINEAYTALARNQSRALYDEALRNPIQGFHDYNIHQPNVNKNPNTNRHGRRMYPDFESMRSAKENEGFWERYYGINGIKRLPNSYIAAGCCVCVVASTIAFIFATRGIANLRREIIQKNNEANMTVYSAVRNRAREKTNEEQMSWLRESLEEKVENRQRPRFQ